jgi:NAD(P)-dependent dehydrogenase (short-subunit alcohol dehydrogenase family)
MPSSTDAPLFSLDERVAVITGAASGIGHATAQRFAAAGAQVVLLDRDDAGPAAQDLGATALRVDVSDEQAVANAMGSVAAEHGRIDVLVNNAGIFAEGLIDETPADDWRRCFEVNTLGIRHGIRHATPHMPHGSAIINTASLAGLIGLPGYAAYTASKAAVVGVTQVAAVEYGPRGIRVNCICPSSVDTPMLAAQDNRDMEVELCRVAAPLGRIIDPREVAALIHFLAAEDCPMLSGLAIPIDGGMTAGMSIALADTVIANIR